MGHIITIDVAPEAQRRNLGSMLLVAAEAELGKYSLTPTATRVIKKAFQMARERNAGRPAN